jgi:hypothetical protein
VYADFAELRAIRRNRYCITSIGCDDDASISIEFCPAQSFRLAPSGKIWRLDIGQAT